MGNECMTYKEFKEKIMQAVGERFHASIKEIAVEKNNGIVLDAMVVMEEGKCMSPTFYFYTLYDKYNEMGFSAVLDEIEEIYRNNRDSEQFELSKYIDWENVMDKIRMRLVNYSLNEKRLQTLPHRRILDLAVLYYVEININGTEKGSILINDYIIGNMGKTEEELFNAAMTYGEEPVFIEMSTLLKMIGDDTGYRQEFDDGIEGEPMYVVSNSQKMYGASAMLDKKALKRFAEENKCEKFYILPSSLHEVIIVPAVASEVDCLRSMVREVNEQCVMREDYLSDSVYVYSCKTNEIEIA